MLDDCRFGITKSQICMVGDRLDTDILFGQNGGCKTLLVLSGNLQVLVYLLQQFSLYAFSAHEQSSLFQVLPPCQCFKIRKTPSNRISTPTGYRTSSPSKLHQSDMVSHPPVSPSADIIMDAPLLFHVYKLRSAKLDES